MDRFDELYHYGVLGMKWGVRRYQKKDGSLTALGRKHQKRAVDAVNDDKRTYERLADEYKNKLPSTRSKGYVPADYYTSDAERYIEFRKKQKTAELLEESYKNGNLEVGLDYIAKKGNNIELTERGQEKAQAMRDKASRMVDENTKDIADKYINEPKKKQEAIDRSHEKAFDIADSIREKLNNKKYTSIDEKYKDIDRMFTENLRKMEKDGDDIAADELQQQWAFVYDEMDME